MTDTAIKIHWEVPTVHLVGRFVFASPIDVKAFCYPITQRLSEPYSCFQTVDISGLTSINFQGICGLYILYSLTQSFPNELTWIGQDTLAWQKKILLVFQRKYQAEKLNFVQLFQQHYLSKERPASLNSPYSTG